MPIKIRLIAPAAAIAFVILFAHATAVVAADVKVLSTFGMRPVLNEIAPEFERSTGSRLVVQYGSSAGLKKQIESGEPFDVAIITPPVINDLIKQKKILDGSSAVVARSGMGVAVRADAPKVDISQVESFRHALLNAKSVAYTPGGTTGTHLAQVLARLGIAEEMKAKNKPEQTPERIVQAVAHGDVELGFTAISTIMATPGIAVLGPFPSELQDYILYTVGVGAASNETEATKTLISLLRTERATSTMKATGLEPLAW
jgi:molybdate transport system substrate-binding protein